MKLLVVAVGQRLPAWAQTACDDYAKRFPPELRLELKAVKAEPRGSKTAEHADGGRARSASRAAHAARARGASCSTSAASALDHRAHWPQRLQGLAAARAATWRCSIGGPDGLDPGLQGDAPTRRCACPT